jgi:thiol-disulfide isomerase/thioredoxin
MSKFLEIIYSKYIKRYEKFILISFLSIVFIIASYYGYKQYYAKKQDTVQKKFSNVANTNTRNENAEVFFFYVDWCPHCKTAKPIWNQFKEKYNNTAVNGYTVKCNEVDCTNESDDPKIADLIAKFKIEGYPTVKIMIGDNQYDFDTKITLSTLKQFVDATTSAQ